MSDTVMPATPLAPPPLALAVGLDLVTRHRLRLADRRDSRLGPLVDAFELSAVAWTGDHPRLVGFYTPPPEPEAAQSDLWARVDAAINWGRGRLEAQGGSRCDVLLVALRPLPQSQLPAPAVGPVQVGVVCADPGTGEVRTLLAPPRSLPSARDIGRRFKALRGGAPPPTLAAVDLAERQAMAAAGRPAGPARVNPTPLLTYGLIASFVVVWLAEQGVLRHIVPAGLPLSPSTGVVGAALNDAQGRMDWWRYVSSSFLHDADGITHVALNCYATFIIGRIVEQLYGRLVMLGTFLVTGATGVLLWVAAALANIEPPFGVSLGASAGICGWIGLLLMLGRVQGRDVPPSTAASIRQWVGINLLLLVGFGLISHSVNNFAHAGGFVGGVLLGLILPPLAAVGGRLLRRPEQVALWGVIAVSAVAMGIAGTHAAQAYGGAAVQAAALLLR
ncbi:MAG: hypothetical protein NVSMB29_12200 [Candidatus Dormibacteria bacterium]